MIRRDDLLRALYEAAICSGAEILFDSQIVELDETVPYVVTKNGKKFVADLIVGVDGKHSP